MRDTKRRSDRQRIVIIGGGGTGAAAALDLAKRGFAPIIIERGELTSGTTGRHHGQLHCGARYALGDRRIARECMQESLILRRIVPQAIEYNEGLFVSVTDEDESYTEQFIEACREADIPAYRISVEQALEREPALDPGIRSAVVVPDGTIDPWRLCLSFFAAAEQAGTEVMRYTEVIGIDIRDKQVCGVRIIDHRTGVEEYIETGLILNAAGAWAGEIAEMAGIPLAVSPSPGSMVAVRGRLCSGVVSRLHPAGDGDIIVPQRGLTIIGSTQWLADDPDTVHTPEGDRQFLLDSAKRMMPAFVTKPVHAVWSASRPLYGAASGQAVRALSRDFTCIDHAATGHGGVIGFFSVIGGKATTLRGMGEAAADAVCARTGVHTPCTTRVEALPDHRSWYGRKEV